ncbi:MAG: tyrosine-protein phosphatase [Parabacteroides sp.]|nr:tyrosine-protein phosphatase [Parabacteroides sp.]
MIVKQILALVISIVLFIGCTSNKAPEIESVCVRDNIGNYIIKWETTPRIEGVLKLYVSDTPDSFDMSNPCNTANINEGIVTHITQDNINRKYFLLSFNDKYFHTIGARSIQMDSVQNMRDIGGYTNKRGKRITQWGKIYRSGELTSLTHKDITRIKSLNIKTIIDLRGEKEKSLTSNAYPNINVISIPIPVKDKELIAQRLEEGQMRKGDGIVFMQDTYLRYLNENSKQFSKALKVFLDEDNYPILVNCSLGKDRTGFLMAMLLSALDIPEQTIIEDYTASNHYINIKHHAKTVRHMNTDAQETITLLLHANESWLELVFKKIKKEYGSTKKFLSKKLFLSEKEQELLKDIVLD